MDISKKIARFNTWFFYSEDGDLRFDMICDICDRDAIAITQVQRMEFEEKHLQTCGYELED